MGEFGMNKSGVRRIYPASSISYTVITDKKRIWSSKLEALKRRSDMEGALIVIIWALFRVFLPFVLLVILGTVLQRQQGPRVHPG